MPTSEDEPPAWSPGEFALERNRWVDPNDANPTIVLLQHPTIPFVHFLDAGDEQQLQGSALEYLRAADERAQLGLPTAWLDSLEEAASPAFGWLPIGIRGQDPIGSFWFEREIEDEANERTLVLLASELFKGEALGSEFGLRVVAHVRRPVGASADEVRFTGMSASLPFGPYVSESSRRDWEEGELATRHLGDFMALVADRVASPLRLQRRSVFFRGFRLGRRADGTWQVELRGRGLDGVGGRYKVSSPPYEFLAEGTLSPQGPQVTFLKRIPLTACAMTGSARVFPRDPASQVGPRQTRKRRPSRPDKARDAQAALDTYRVVRQVLQQLPASAAKRPLRVPGRLEILKSWYVLEDHPAEDPNNPANDVKRVRLPGGAGPAIRSNDFSALNAFRHLWQLFERFQDYGINPVSYFKNARLPIRGMYRSGIRPGPGKDGQTINASVQPDGWRPGDTGPTNSGNKPTLRVHLALGDLSRRARKRWTRPPPPQVPTPSQAEPLGIAADARWVWHELGHVLLMASVGELELRFAHSTGDALAAIVADPSSDLAADSNWRGATFPWVFVPRRHDRCVRNGWSWSGSLHRPLALVPDAQRVRRKGYWTEQILSSSLFRLYRCLGGDTIDPASNQPDQTARKSASDYAVYLIIKGIGLLGNVLYAPANRPEQLVAALIKADVGTTVFTPQGPLGLRRIGGCAHKVIRWAFEAQGMYPADPAVISNARGRPPAVDIFIQDRRPSVETIRHCSVDYGPGSYVPVSLDWSVWGGGVPEWFALDRAVENQGGQIFVTVGNRGHQTATGVTVSVWWRAWPSGSAPPEWDATQWTASGSQPPAQDIPRGQTRRFGGFALGAGAGRLLVFAQATCADDRANTDPLTLLPCSLLPTPLPDLVADDNNLGLIVVS